MYRYNVLNVWSYNISNLVQEYTNTNTNQSSWKETTFYDIKHQNYKINVIFREKQTFNGIRISENMVISKYYKKSWL